MFRRLFGHGKLVCLLQPLHQPAVDFPSAGDDDMMCPAVGTGLYRPKDSVVLQAAGQAERNKEKFIRAAPDAADRQGGHRKNVPAPKGNLRLADGDFHLRIPLRQFIPKRVIHRQHPRPPAKKQQLIEFQAILLFPGARRTCRASAAGPQASRLSRMGDDHRNAVRHTDGDIHILRKPARMDADLVGAVGVQHPHGVLPDLQRHVDSGQLLQRNLVGPGARRKVDREQVVSVHRDDGGHRILCSGAPVDHCPDREDGEQKEHRDRDHLRFVKRQLVHRNPSRKVTMGAAVSGMDSTAISASSTPSSTMGWSQ